MPMQRVVKPKTQKAKRALENREPKAIENTKEALFLKGSKVSEVVTAVLKDLHALKKPFSEQYTKKNDIRPFEDFSQVEQYCKKVRTMIVTIKRTRTLAHFIFLSAGRQVPLRIRQPQQEAAA